MWGPNDLMCDGNMKLLDLTEEVGAIALPTLFVSGEFDRCTPGVPRGTRPPLVDRQSDGRLKSRVR
jgi:hypothetical protein